MHCKNCQKGKIITENSETEFSAIQQAFHIIQHQASAIHNLDEVYINVPSQFDVSVYSYHHWCNKKFTDSAGEYFKYLHLKYVSEKFSSIFFF